MNLKAIVLFCLVLVTAQIRAQKNYHKLVNPFIGTGGHGHTYPGATSPFGMVQLSPDTRMADWDGSSGYHYSDSIIYGFSHTHLSGTGVSDYCDILLQPSVGSYEWDNNKYASGFHHKNEKAYAGYYNVFLEKYNIEVALTTTQRTGLHQYTFSKETKTGNVILDLVHRDIVLDSYVEIVDSFTVKGYRFSKSWANNQKLFFILKFNQPITKNEIHIDSSSTLLTSNTAKGKNIKTGFSFDLSKGKPLLVQIGLSAVSMDGAVMNLIAEQPNFNFEKTLKQNTDSWDKELSKIEIESLPFKNIDTIFYTSLYHTMIVPNIYEDVDGKYRGTDDKIHTTNGFTNYTVFSLWDTYRAYHPLMSIINKKRTKDWINTFINQYKNGGMLPVWELSGNETFCMIGYHSVPVIVDAYKKGIRDFDTELALEAMLRYSKSNKFGINEYAKQGFLSNNIEAESVSKTLEYAYDDWCIAEFAKLLGKEKTADEYYLRSEHYRNLFNPSTNFFQGKLHGSWVKPFDPTEVNNFYTEGNAWHYRFAVPQNLSGLKELIGGEDKFATSLKNMFATSSTMTGREQADVTGLMGQYAHGNEPSHHIAYLFADANLKDNKTPFLVDKICNEFYKNTPDGLIGNEDCGQMSAWYIWSALGMYPVNPASNEFTIGSPQIKKATIHLENGKDIVINANRKNIKAYFPLYSTNKIKFDNIKNGAIINFAMKEENKIKRLNISTSSAINKKKLEAFVAVPFLENDNYKFKYETIVTLKSIEKESKIKYKIVTKDALTSTKFIKYIKPFSIKENSNLFFYAEKGTYKSAEVNQPFYKLPTDKTITILSKVNPMYTAGGNESLIDGIIGTSNWRAGEWQSYYGNDFEAVIDLKKIRNVSTISATFLQDIQSWIWMPKQLEVYSSDDNINFKLQNIIKTTIAETDENVQVDELRISLENCKAQYIKVKAINYGTIGKWHLGVGNNAHLFVSEIGIN